MDRLGWHSLGTSFDCVCGVRHELPIEACYTGPEAASELARFARGRCGDSVLVISDENTRQAGGEAVLTMLGLAGKQIEEKIFAADAIEANEAYANETAEAGKDCDFYVAIGAGTLSDLAKYAGTAQGKPVLLFPTAASMNGYTSGIVALKVRGLKRTLPCRPATGIFADPSVVATAPPRMTAAGVADFLSKASSASDWRAAHLLRGDYYCRRPREFCEGLPERLIEAAPAIGRGDAGAVGLVLEALLLSGLGMLVAGSSAPASGGEHLISHYLDMKHARKGSAIDMHGIQVGVATVHTLGLWERILALRAEDIDPKALAAKRYHEKEIRAWIFDDWGPEIGREVLAQWRQKALSATRLRAEIEQIREMLPRFRALLLEDLLPPTIVARCIEECGGPTRPQDMTASQREYKKALQYARFLRNRFTVLDLAAELGLA